MKTDSRRYSASAVSHEGFRRIWQFEHSPASLVDPVEHATEILRQDIDSDAAVFALAPFGPVTVEELHDV
jgi:hypothetical protein